MTNASQVLIYAAIGGILPALVWLLFWLREDSKRPEPKGLVLKTFVLGMLAVPLILPLQYEVGKVFLSTSIVAILLWALLEEGFKFGAGYLGGIRSPEDNEPMDSIIYMITAALGFSAIENTLFLLEPLAKADFPTAILTSNLRFIGPSLLHVVASGIIGAGLALSFYKSRNAKIAFALTTFALAVLIHTAYNLLIISNSPLGGLNAVMGVWVSIIVLLFFFEKAKTIAPENI
jgi:protease PrsW